MSTASNMSGRVASRDALRGLLGHLRRALRYWWLFAVIMAVGGVLSVLFALSREPLYQSSSVVFYNERIMTHLIVGRDTAAVSRNVGERYRELLLARTHLKVLIEDLKLVPEIVSKRGIEPAVDELRKRIQFDIRGGNVFRISYKDPDPERAFAVTDRLTKSLLAEDARMRRDQATATSGFLTEETRAAEESLEKIEHEVAEFLTRHPEYANEQDRTPAMVPDMPELGENVRLGDLEKERDQLRVRLSTLESMPAGANEPGVAARNAEQRMTEARRELEQAQRDLTEKESRYTAKHPNLIAARERLASARQRAGQAEAEYRAVNKPTGSGSSTVGQRQRLQLRLFEIERRIEKELRAQRPGETRPVPVAPPTDDAVAKIVGLETEWARLRRDQNEARQTVDDLRSRLADAEILSRAQGASEGGGLNEVDAAFLPYVPTGKGRILIVIGGLVLFATLGLAMSIGLALLDDRIYLRDDLDMPELPPVLAYVPREPRKSRKQNRYPPPPPPSDSGEQQRPQTNPETLSPEALSEMAIDER
jgi:polysaccharide biosynthesis transport protein